MKSRAAFMLLEARPHRPESGEYLSAALLAELRARWPQFFYPKKVGFHVNADTSDPVYADVVAFLRLHGREPYFKHWPALANLENLWPSHYQVHLTRTFEPEDFTGLRCVSMFPSAWMAEPADRVEDVLRVKRLSIQDEVLGFAQEAILCGDSLRTELERQNFMGLHFRRVVVVEDDYEYLGILPPTGAPPILWELWSDLQAPRVTNPLVNNMGEPYDSARDGSCCVDDNYWPPLASMGAEEVISMEPFDFTEHRAPLAYRKMVSRRFFEWCEARKLKIEWHPIVLE